MTAEELRLRGIAASPGVAIGRAYIIDRRKVKTPKRHLNPEEVDREIRRFEDALRKSHEQLERIKQKLTERASDEGFHILEAHQLILKDEHLVEPTLRAISEEHINAEWALRKTVEHIKGIFDSVDDQYFRERRSDVDFVGDRILRNLLGEEIQAPSPPPDAIVVAHELSPADTAQLQRAAIAGFCTDAGGKTSHTAILARAFELPAVVGLEDITARVGNGDLIIIDGVEGEVIIHPPAALVSKYRSRAKHYAALEEEALKTRDLESITLDEHRVRITANVELLEEIPSAVDHGAQGIGLFRTEFLFLGRSGIPSEDDHYEHARAVLEQIAPRPATFRTFDLGGDKAASVIPSLHLREANPALGLRSVRLCLREKGLFKSQLRGLLRASVHGRMRIMFPMISGVGELRQVKQVYEEVQAELRKDGVPFSPDVPCGIMIEMPSAALTADMLAKHADFFAIGTNDLIQYSLAIDRVNEHVSYLYNPLHPAIVRQLRFVVDAAHREGITVCVCGEMAGEAQFAPVLLGLGVDELSMNPTSIPVVKTAVRATSFQAARELVSRIADLPTSEEIEAALLSYVARNTSPPPS